MKKGAMRRPFSLEVSALGQAFFVVRLAAGLRAGAFLAAGFAAAFLAADLRAGALDSTAAEGRRGCLPRSSMGLDATVSNNLS